MYHPDSGSALSANLSITNNDARHVLVPTAFDKKQRSFADEREVGETSQIA